jgi:cytochrome P450/ferredoxin-NADP reductase
MISTFAPNEITLEELEDDPYPIYGQLRRHAPVAWVPAAGMWFVTRFADCAAVGSDAATFVGAAHHPTLDRVFGTPNVLTSPGEAHDDLRRGIDPSLQPGPVNAMVDVLVRQMARRHLAVLAGRDRAELMADYFEPISAEALAAVLGLDNLVDTDTLRRWFSELAIGVVNNGQDPEKFARSDAVATEITQVVTPLLKRLARQPDESMLSHMLHAGRDGDGPRDIAQILPSLMVILMAGMQEPGHAGANTLLGLLQWPDQLARVCAEPELLIPTAVNEGLRWMPPIGSGEREATRDVELHGVTIPRGQIVGVIHASANRDETRFVEPDVYDLDRSTRTHQAFGNGEHFCAGHFFGRQVVRIMLEELLPVVPGLRLDDERAPKVAGWALRAPIALPVRWDGAAPRRRETVHIPTSGAVTGADASVPLIPPGTFEVVARSLTWEADGVLSMHLVDSRGGDLPAWQPGAHIDVWLGTDRVCQYSLCGAPADRGTWRIGVLREADSRGGSRFVHDELRPGNRLRVGSPRQNFPLVDAERYLFIAGGIGITPLLPMIAEVDRRGLPWRLAYGGRTRTSMAFLDELSGYGTAVSVVPQDESGLLDLPTVLADLDLVTALYCCGPEGLLSAVETWCDDHGHGELHVERFRGVKASTLPDNKPVEIVLQRSGRIINVPANRSILEELEDNGVRVFNACREGVCGSCETRVLAGVPEHHDVLMTDAEKEACDRMMICVSRARSPQLVLDL